MINLFWKLVAKLVARPKVVDWLIARAQKTPYTHIYDKTGDMYMGRWWLFNPYEDKRSWLPSIRLHWIAREDRDRHMHDHPWDARSIVLRGHYLERRQGDPRLLVRSAGRTSTLKFGEYHIIEDIHPEGCWTMFITYRYRGTWGFLVDGKKIPWREYLGVGDEQSS